jgi:hypothetical protein
VLSTSASNNALPLPVVRGRWDRRRPFPGMLTLAALVLTPLDAAAQEPGVEACLHAHEEGQLLRNRGKLRAAQATFGDCARETCPSVVRQACSDLLSQVQSSLPTVVVAAQDERGADIAAVSVVVDGEVLRGGGDGMPVAVDPGEHAFRFESTGFLPVEQRLIVLSGEKERRLPVRFVRTPEVRASAPAAPVPQREVEGAPRVSPLAYILAGVSAVGVGSFSYFALSGTALERDRARTCSPKCTDGQVAGIHRDYAIADVSLGVAVIALGAAVWLFTHPTTPAKASGSIMRATEVRF